VMVAAYKPVGKAMTKKELASLVGTLGSLMRVAPLVQLYLREAYMLIGQPRWRAPVQLTQMVVSDLAWIGSHFRMLHGGPKLHVSAHLRDSLGAAGCEGLALQCQEG